MASDREGSFRVKVEVMSRGMSLSDDAEAEIRRINHGATVVNDYPTTNGVILVLPPDVYVNAAVAKASPGVPALDWAADRGFRLTGQAGVAQVRVLPLPSVALESRFDGVAVHADRVRVSPIDGCSFACAFCDSHLSPYRKRPIEQLVSGIREAETDGRSSVRHVLVSGGNPRDADWPWLLDAYARIKESTSLPVDVMLAPSAGAEALDRVRACGVHGVAINMELFDEGQLRAHCPSKCRLGREAYRGMLEHAVEVFGRGHVRSLLLLGIEPVETTLRGVEYLAALGVNPVLSPLMPAPGTPFENPVRLSPDELLHAFLRAESIAARHGVRLGPLCIPCQHNTLTRPDDSGDYGYS